jgi:hypothetical protein
VAYPRWIEDVIGLDPDRGNGAVEWLVVLVAASAALAFGLRARRSLQQWYSREQLD